MDINPFEIAGKTVRRTSESVMDAYCASQGALFDRFFPDGFKEEQSTDIMTAAKVALQHGDRQEATHQLNRNCIFAAYSTTWPVRKTKSPLIPGWLQSKLVNKNQP